MASQPALSDRDGWMEHPDSIRRRARQSAARNPEAAEQLTGWDSAVIREAIERLSDEGGRHVEDLRVLLHAELLRRVVSA